MFSPVIISILLECKYEIFSLLPIRQTIFLLTEVCKDVKVEPPLHPLTGENLREAVANKSDDARLDISARGFWSSGQRAFFDIKVSRPIARRGNKYIYALCTYIHVRQME